MSSAIVSYTDRITKLLPTEFVGTYLAMTQVAQQSSLTWRQPLLIMCLVVCLFLIPIYLKQVKKIDSFRYRIVVTLSFLVWVYALGDVFEPGQWIRYNLYNPSIGAGLMILWGLVPLVMDIDPEKMVNNEN